MPKKTNKKLLVEYIPKSCHYSNSRSMFSKKDWDKIRKISYEQAGYKCEICGEDGLEQGYGHALECHEIFEYDDENLIQKLVGLISLCPLCHLTTHYGRCRAMGKTQACNRRLQRINTWTPKKLNDHLIETLTIYKIRSGYEWSLDLTYLEQEPYNLILEENAKRIFNKPKPYKRKRRAAKKKAVKKRPKKY